MARTPSTMRLGLGATAPDFNLPDAEGTMHNLCDFSDAKALLVMFICNHCPFVIHVADELAKVAKDFKDRGLAVVAINANDVANYPDDSPEKMKEFARAHGFDFPYLYDERQEVAKAYHAACTPDFFLFKGNMELVYRGQLDDARPGNDEPVNGKDMRAAIETTLAGEPVEGEQLPSMGCNIKWKAGNEPSYVTST